MVRSRLIGLGLALALGLCSGGTLALPMGSKGDGMVMLDTSPDQRELAANFAVSTVDAWGLALGRWSEPGVHGVAAHERSREFVAATYTRRVQRWNLPHAQANVWLVGMVGQVRGQGLNSARSLGSLALMADYETTRVYVGAGLRPMRASGVRHDSTWLRSGFSFYEADYDEVQPWFVLEAKRVNFGSSAKNEVTPMLRFIHKRVFVEIGGNRDGAQFNLMWSP